MPSLPHVTAGRSSFRSATRRAVPPAALTVQMSSGSPSVSTEAGRADRPSSRVPNDTYCTSDRAPVWSADANAIVEPDLVLHPPIGGVDLDPQALRAEHVGELLRRS